MFSYYPHHYPYSCSDDGCGGLTVGNLNKRIKHCKNPFEKKQLQKDLQRLHKCGF